MDASTAAFYAANAAVCAARYEKARVSSLHAVLRTLASSKSRVLEIGGGSGRDSLFMYELGCDITYTDGCAEMVDQAVSLHPQLQTTARVVAFPLSEGDALSAQRYDLVLCIAVIMHLDDSMLDRLALQLGTLVRAGGHLVLSHSRGHQDIVANRDSKGRLFFERSVRAVDHIFEMLGFNVKQQIEGSDGLGRESIVWTTKVLQKTA